MNIFGINGGELIVLIVLALLLLGPDKIPEYLRKLREWIHKARQLAEGAKEQFKEETGTDFDEVDWQKYDPRQYDPRRVIREALSEPIEDLEASLTDAKNTIHDAADTVKNQLSERPRLTQAEILAAAVPIDQLNQQPQFPDPSNPAPAITTTDPVSTPTPASTTPLAEADTPGADKPITEVQPGVVHTAPDESEDDLLSGTPFDAEAT